MSSELLNLHIFNNVLLRACEKVYFEVIPDQDQDSFLISLATLFMDLNKNDNILP